MRMCKRGPLGLGEGTKGYREHEMQEQERTPERAQIECEDS